MSPAEVSMAAAVGSPPSRWWRSAGGCGRQQGQEIRVVGGRAGWSGGGGSWEVEVNWW
jgi:hypothetical protein